MKSAKTKPSLPATADKPSKTAKARDRGEHRKAVNAASAKMEFILKERGHAYRGRKDSIETLNDVLKHFGMTVVLEASNLYQASNSKSGSLGTRLAIAVLGEAFDYVKSLKLPDETSGLRLVGEGFCKGIRKLGLEKVEFGIDPVEAVAVALRLSNSSGAAEAKSASIDLINRALNVVTRWDDVIDTHNSAADTVLENWPIMPVENKKAA